MKRAVFVLLANIFLCLNLSAQTIQAKIVDSSKTPIIGATAILFGADSSYLNSGVTDIDGLVSIDAQISGQSRLLIQHLSYEDLEIVVSSQNLGEIVMIDRTNSLENIVVKGERNAVTAENGKLLYNIQAISDQGVVNNAYEAIVNLPGVRENDDALELTGAGTPTIIINGKPSSMTTEQLTALLKSTPVENIDKVEVMYSTPPQYNVRGSSINIVMRRSGDRSVRGQVYGGFSNKVYNSYNGGGSIAFSSPEWSVDLTYSLSREKNDQQMWTLSNHTVDGVLSVIEQENSSDQTSISHIIRAAAEYAPKDKGIFRASYTSTLKPSIQTYIGSTGSYVQTTSDLDDKSNLHNISASYTGTKGFDIGIDYTYYNTYGQDFISNNYLLYEDNAFNTTSEQTVNRLKLYLDKSHTLEGGWGMNYGIKLETARDHDFQEYTILEGDIDNFDTDSELKEYVANAYVGFNKNFARGSLSLSASGEYYEQNGQWEWTFYPQASFNWMFNANNMIQFSFSSNRVYPPYWTSQESITYMDGYSEVHGSPYLTPYNSYSSQMIYIFKQKYMAVLFWENSPNYFMQTTYQSSEELALIYQYNNYDYNRQYGINIIIPFSSTPWLSHRLSLVGVRQQQRCSDFYDISFDRDCLLGIASIDNDITISQQHNIKLTVNGLLQGRAIQATYDIDPLWRINTGLKWGFADNKATLSARVDDVFNTSVIKLKVDYANQNLEMIPSSYYRKFSLNFSYLFGGYKSKAHKQVDDSRLGH